MSTLIKLSSDGEAWKFISIRAGLEFLYGTEKNILCQGVSGEERACKARLALRQIEQILVVVSLEGKVRRGGLRDPDFLSARSSAASLQDLLHGDNYLTKNESFVSVDLENTVFDTLIWFSCCGKHRHGTAYEKRKTRLRKTLADQLALEKHKIHSTETFSKRRSPRGPLASKVSPRSTKIAAALEFWGHQTPGRPSIRRSGNSSALQQCQSKTSNDITAIISDWDTSTPASELESPIFDSPEASDVDTPLTGASSLWSNQKSFYAAATPQGSMLEHDESDDEFYSADEEPRDISFPSVRRRLFTGKDFSEQRPTMDRGPRSLLLTNPSPTTGPIGNAKTQLLPISQSPRPNIDWSTSPDQIQCTPKRTQTMPIMRPWREEETFDVSYHIQRRHSFHSLSTYHGFSSDFDKQAAEAVASTRSQALRHRKSFELASAADEESELEEEESKAEEDADVAAPIQVTQSPSCSEGPHNDVRGVMQTASNATSSLYNPHKQYKYKHGNRQSLAAELLWEILMPYHYVPPKQGKNPYKTDPGWVYGYITDKNRDFIKIGRSKYDTRMDDWATQCDNAVDEVFNHWMERGAGLAEKMIHIQLSRERRTKRCDVCIKKTRIKAVHTEWFEVDEIKAGKCVDLWRRFQEVHPYGKDTGQLNHDWAVWSMTKFDEIQAGGKTKTGKHHQQDLDEVIQWMSQKLGLGEGKKPVGRMAQKLVMPFRFKTEAV
ncbi:GIY-YIG nuclease family protein [Microdochium nivale]|nr:GIY-YIG nuclease family protein [Microdochium nivale]